IRSPGAVPRSRNRFARRYVFSASWAYVRLWVPHTRASRSGTAGQMLSHRSAKLKLEAGATSVIADSVSAKSWRFSPSARRHDIAPGDNLTHRQISSNEAEPHDRQRPPGRGPNHRVLDARTG